MQRYTPTQSEMKSRTARFKELVSTKSRISEKFGIPADVMEMITAKATFNVMSPGPMPGKSRRPLQSWEATPACSAWVS
jgi:hypothetical protein